ncbi:glycerophosphodiester phosphodiesterase family protein [Woodsholea maritima]|uniref:glycerophosphodiester phosphodiesterase family protein n=1 Tax=Woodsholea maritima TaxID=240237 RepID=UPI00036B8D81|nr:glycerophosphodiester phosphodiesterase family protein [Woodsholea maritima]
MSQTHTSWEQETRPAQTIGLSTERPLWLLSAHRGIHGKLYEDEAPIPENSIQAINEAGARLYEIVELDIHVDANNEAVLFHDYTVGRTAGTDWNPTIDPPSALGGPLATSDISGGGVIVDGYPMWMDIYDEDEAEVIFDANELVNSIDDWTGYDLRGFDRDAGNFTNPTQNDPVATLEEALTHIGRYYPGMVVVLDLRHQAEVEAAMNAVDKVEDCRGEPARNWVVFKPFANIYRGGFAELGSYNRYNLEERTDGRWANYYWIPVLSSRLSRDLNRPGQPSLYPNSVGPDIRTISMPDRTYVDLWFGPNWYPQADNVLGFELYYSPSNTVLLDSATNSYDRLNVTSWRPPDMRHTHRRRTYRYTPPGSSSERVVRMINNTDGYWELNKCYYDAPAPTVLEGAEAAIGYNFKDDGLGRYVVTYNGYGCLQDKMDDAQVLTIDHGDAVMWAFRGETRPAIFRLGSQYNTQRDNLIRQLRPLLTPTNRFPLLPGLWDEFTRVADEKGMHNSFTMPHNGVVYYGQSEFKMRYFFRGDRVNCNNATFGDPDVGEKKRCRIINPNSAGSMFTSVARENHSFTMQNDGWVFYSLHGALSVEYFEKGEYVRCNNSTFGDPAPENHKHCWVRDMLPPAGTQFCSRFNATCDPRQLIDIYGDDYWAARFTRPANIEVIYGYADSRRATLYSKDHIYSRFGCNREAFPPYRLDMATEAASRCYIRRNYNRTIPYSQ